MGLNNLRGYKCLIGQHASSINGNKYTAVTGPSTSISREYKPERVRTGRGDIYSVARQSQKRTGGNRVAVAILIVRRPHVDRDHTAVSLTDNKISRDQLDPSDRVSIK
jgi:hypothetical protein